MSQTFVEIAGGTMLTASRGQINNNFEALKTSFSGSSAPFTATAAVEGAEYYNTTDKKTYRVLKSGSTYYWGLPPENVHTSGAESIAGAKTFTDNITAPNITTMASTLSTLSSTAAHLAGEETFTGNKTFSGSVALGSNATAETKTAGNNSTSVATTAHVKLLVPVSIGSSTKPVYTNASGIITASNATVGSSSQPVYMNSGTITAISGSIANDTTGNAATATILKTARTINGTSFDGSGNITTSNWGTARNISISDADATNTGTAVSVNGSGAVTLKLPSTIKANLTGNATAVEGTQAFSPSNVGNHNVVYVSDTGNSGDVKLLVDYNDNTYGQNAVRTCLVSFNRAGLCESLVQLRARNDGTTDIGLLADAATAPTPSSATDNSTNIATTAFIANKFQVVSALPANPVAGVFYFITE